MKTLKKIFEYSVWLPFFGLITMLALTEFGRYRYVYFAGSIWPLYQVVCFAIIVLINALCN